MFVITQGYGGTEPRVLLQGYGVGVPSPTGKGGGSLGVGRKRRDGFKVERRIVPIQRRQTIRVPMENEPELAEVEKLPEESDNMKRAALLVALLVEDEV